MAALRRCAAFCNGSPVFRLTSHRASAATSLQSCRPRMTAAVSYPVQNSTRDKVNNVIERARARTSLLFQKAPKENGGSGGGGSGNSGWGGGRGGGGGGDGGDQNPFQRIVAAYIEAQERRPILTKSTSTLVLTMLGDYCAQRIAAAQAGRAFELDMRRWFSVGTFGFCFMGPTLHYWYGTLDRLFGNRAVWKMATDQLLFSIPFNSAFIVGVGTLEGKGGGEVRDALRDKWWATAKSNWCLWVPAQYCNFAIVPKHFQMIYVNCVGFVWNVVLTYITHSTMANLEEVGLRS